MTMALTLFCSLPLSSASTNAHEFWMEPETYRPALKQAVPLRHFIGQNFKGTSYPFVPDWFKTFTLTQNGSTTDVVGVLGDDPAATLRFTKPGLKILAYHSRPDKLTFKKWPDFRDYLLFEGLNGVVDRWGKRLSTQATFREDYVRCAKTLMQAGELTPGENGTSGADRAIGLPLELIAEQNPFTLAKGATLPVRLLLNGKPLQGALVRILTRTDPVNIPPVRTDKEGRARIPLPHSGPYLLNAVTMLNTALPEKGEAWKSLWASLSFSVR